MNTPEHADLILQPDGYMKSFSVDECEEYKAFFDTHGFVVLDNILTTAECNSSCDEVWESLQLQEPMIDRQDPRTWSQKYWPKTICSNGGFMGKFPYWKRMNSLKETFVANQLQAWKNRENPLIYEAFRNILSRRRLWASIDRYGIMRPSKQKELLGPCVEGVDEHEDWATKSQWLHWDLSPFHFGTSAAGFGPRKKVDYKTLQETYGSTRLQGLVCLTDCPVENGGFHCVPGFHHRFFKWRNENIDGYGAQADIRRRNFIEVPEDDPMRQHILQVPMKKGSLLIWNSMLPHGNFPNRSSSEFRMVQYIKMIPVDDPREFSPAISSSKFDHDAWFPKNYELSRLGKCLFGMQDWDETDDIDEVR